MITDRMAGMPFAVIAVALLLASTALVATVHSYSDTDDDAGGVLDGMDDADMAVADIQVYVNRGLGDVVRGLSNADDGVSDARDTLEERAETFRAKAGEWLDFQFPIRSGQVRAELIGYELDLTADAMAFESPDSVGGYTPAYLRGTGTLHLRVQTEDGSGEIDMDISTDGTYALPLSAERQSLFESMAGSGGVSVSQMMTYQLTSLAQYRVMNGYGAMSQYGERGTSSIITESDVVAAYRNALDAVSQICFRDPDGSFAGRDSVDLSDLVASEDGMLHLDLSAVYAQALMSVIDDIALRWFDYFCGFEFAEGLVDVLFPVMDAVESLAAFILGDEAVYSAVPYIEDMMALAGFDPDEYRNPGAGTTTVSVSGITVSVPNPTADVLDMPWLKDFRKRYQEDSNFVTEFIMDVLRGASVAISEDRGLGTVSVAVDPYDGETFIEALAHLFESAVDGSGEVVESAVSASLSGVSSVLPQAARASVRARASSRASPLCFMSLSCFREFCGAAPLFVSLDGSRRKKVPPSRTFFAGWFSRPPLRAPCITLTFSGNSNIINLNKSAWKNAQAARSPRGRFALTRRARPACKARRSL